MAINESLGDFEPSEESLQRGRAFVSGLQALRISMIEATLTPGRLKFNFRDEPGGLLVVPQYELRRTLMGFKYHHGSTVLSHGVTDEPFILRNLSVSGIGERDWRDEPQQPQELLVSGESETWTHPNQHQAHLASYVYQFNPGEHVVALLSKAEVADANASLAADTAQSA